MTKKQATNYLENYIKDKKEMLEKYGNDGRTLKDEKMLIEAIECLHYDDWCKQEAYNCRGCYYDHK